MQNRVGVSGSAGAVKPWGRRLFLTGAWVLVLCGLVHIAGHIAIATGLPENETERQMFTLMRSYRMSGVERTMQELLNGFSLTFVVLPVMLGTLCILIARAGDARLMRQAALAAGLGMVAESAVGLSYWFFIPNTFVIAAAVAFAASWALLGRENRATGA